MAEQRQSPLTVALIVVVALMALASSDVSAAATWSSPQTVSPPVSGGPGLDFDARGRALASWSSSRGWQTATRAPGAAQFAPGRAAPDFAAPLVVYGYVRALALERRSLGRERCGGRISLRARFGRSDGAFGASDRISSFVPRGILAYPDVALAVNDGGQALAAWIAATRRCKFEVVRIALRSPGRKFDSPITLRSGGGYEARSISAAVGQGGDTLVAWNRARRVEARYRPAGGRWGPVQRVGTIPDFARVLTAVAQNGRAYVAWSVEKLGESDPLRVVGVAVRPANAARFGKAQILEQSNILDFQAHINLGLQIARPGTGAVLAWTGWNGPSGFTARVADTSGLARFGAPQWVSPAGRRFGVGDLAVGVDGLQVLAMSELDDENAGTRVFAAIRLPGGLFGPPEEISAAGSSSQAVAVDPITRRPTVVWSERTGAGLSETLRASTRVP